MTINTEYIISGVVLGGIVIALILIPIVATDKVIIIDDSTGGNFTDTTVCVNVGTGKLIVKSSTDGDCEIKSLVGSSDISITNDTNTIIIDFNGTVSGESTQCINVGSGTIVIKNSTSGNCFVKTFIAGSGLSISNTSDTITYTNTAQESTVCTNLGSVGEGIYQSGNCNFKKILDGTGIKLTVNSTRITISTSFNAGTGISITGSTVQTFTNTLPEVTACNNVGSGNQLCSGGNVNVDTIIAGDGITITDTTDDWTFARTRTFNLESIVFQSVTKTNLPTTYTDIYTSAFDAENFTFIDCTGVTFFEFYYGWDFVGAGTDQVRWVQVSNNNNVLAEASVTSSDQDPGSVLLVPPPVWCTGLVAIEMQAKSSNGTNDPIAKGYTIWAN